MPKKASLILAIGWTLLIAVLCLIKFSNLPSLGVSGADKYVHITLHFGFTLLWGIYSRQKHNEIVVPRIIKIVIASILYGILIEFLQETCTTTRHADIFDVLANLTGALIALAVFLISKREKQRE
ncbi:MAG TPA: VanZ family protein [Flavobacterium sp.]|uniref:VanZ family protein n=1 Tax=Flavobacterium sp. TaxID=239 RepID=UPI002C2ED1CA|nr:VanZ family protein [Flavobacterium sp.]HNP33708.1 VanZ family protein [Flavobacterium sp.]